MKTNKCPYCGSELINGIIGSFSGKFIIPRAKIYVYKKNNQNISSVTKKKEIIDVSINSNYKPIKLCKTCNIFIGKV